MAIELTRDAGVPASKQGNADYGDYRVALGRFRGMGCADCESQRRPRGMGLSALSAVFCAYLTFGGHNLPGWARFLSGLMGTGFAASTVVLYTRGRVAGAAPAASEVPFIDAQDVSAGVPAVIATPITDADTE